MRSTAVLALVVSIVLPGVAAAQSPPANVGDNANIIPIYKTSDPPAPDDYLRGNLLGQRCNEPSIGISTINRDHMMVFCNDYRATFNYDDAIVPAGKASFASAVWSGVKTFFAWVTGRHKAHRGDPDEEGERIIASAEAGIGGGVSYDGGLTWQGFMVPGGPNDNTPASLAHPGKALNLQGYSDPFAVSMPGGRVGVAYIGFTRDKTTGQSTQSGIFFTVYRDLNASDVVHDWEYEFSSQVALSQNLTQGQFLDKVSAAVAPSGTVYVAYTRFTGSSGSSNIYLAQSTNGGVTWTSAAIDTNAKYGQATVALPNPNPASGAMGVLWRTFGSPSTLLFKSTAKNAKNVDLFANDPLGPYKPFDQYTQPINGDWTRVAFRTLAFPAAAYTPDGSRLVVVFTEWIDLSKGVPGTTGTPMPMVVMKFSTDSGATWSSRYILNWVNGEYGNTPASPERLGFFSPARAVGAQLMPAVACTVGNQCLVVWKQSYDPTLQPGGPENLGSYVTAGFTRRFDARGAFLTLPSTGSPSASASFQVSRYGYRDLSGQDKPGDVHDTNDWVARMTLPNGTSYPMFDWGNLNHTGAGKIAFVGDYIGVKELATGTTSPAFMVAFSDNRYNIWPWETVVNGAVQVAAAGTEWSNYPYFMAPNDPQNIIPGVSCVNYGSRVQSVMTAKVTPSALQVTAQTNHKDFNASVPAACGGSLVGSTWVPTQQCIEFPVTVRNNTGTKQAVALSLTGSASFAKRAYRPDLGEAPYAYPLALGSVTIFPYSSYALDVYAYDGNVVTVTASAGGNTSTLALNDPNVVGSSATAQFSYVPSTINLQSGSARSGSARSGSARSGSARSGSARSYPVPDNPVPGQTVYDVIDTTYVVTPSSQNDAGTYLSLFNIDPAYQGNYVFQVIVTKPLTSFMTDSLNECSAFNWTEGALLGHISDPTNPLVNGSARSGSARSGSARSAIPSDGDPVVQNTSFTLGSSTSSGTATGTASASTQTSTTSTASSYCRIDLCTLAAPRLRNEVTILLRAYQINPNPTVVYDPDGSITGTPTRPSVAVSEYSCSDPSCTAALGPDLVVQTSPPPAPSIVPNTHVRAGGQVTYPTVTINNQGVDGNCGTSASPQPCGDAGTHQWSVYASTEGNFSNLPRLNCAVDTCTAGQVSGMVKLNTDPTKGPITVLLTSGNHPGPVPVGGSEAAAVGSVTIPASIPRPNNGTGTYYLHFYDDSGRVVNELDETNNDWTEGPIIVDAPGWGFLGLQTPCSGTTCTKTGTLPLAWQFTEASVPVDTISTPPQIKFYASCPTPLGADGYPSGSVLASSSPNPATLTSGSSGWQYFPNTGMSRPQYSWQFNFDSSGLPRGTCYSMYVEVPATGQVIGSTTPGLKPFGPFLITPQ
jgi:hypothetical protein